MNTNQLLLDHFQNKKRYQTLLIANQTTRTIQARSTVKSMLLGCAIQSRQKAQKKEKLIEAGQIVKANAQVKELYQPNRLKNNLSSLITRSQSLAPVKLLTRCLARLFLLINWSSTSMKHFQASRVLNLPTNYKIKSSKRILLHLIPKALHRLEMLFMTCKCNNKHQLEFKTFYHNRIRLQLMEVSQMQSQAISMITMGLIVMQTFTSKSLIIKDL